MTFLVRVAAGSPPQTRFIHELPDVRSVLHEVQLQLENSPDPTIRLTIEVSRAYDKDL